MTNGIRLQCLLVVLVLLPAGLLRAQETPAQRYQEEIVVRVIDVDVVVTDREGRFLTDLERENFELLEDGKAVEIRYFSRVVDGRLMDVPVPAAPVPAAPVPAEPTTESGTVRIPLTWVVFLDQTSIPPRYRNQSMEQLRAFLEGAMAEGDRGLVASNNGMAFRIQQGVTNVRSQILNTLTKLKKEPIHQGSAVTQANRIRNEILMANPADRFFADIGRFIAGEIGMIIEEEVRRTRHAILAMKALIDVLARVEGRLAVVYVGAGFNTLPGLALTEFWRTRFPMLMRQALAPRPEDYQTRLEEEITGLYANLSASRITVYTVYAGDSSTLIAADDPGMFLEGGRAGERASLGEAALAREMSDRTGGLFFKANPGLVGQLGAVRRDLSNYYSLGYVPAGAPGKPRRVRVRVNVKGARVRHREAVRERTPREEAARAAIAATVAPPSRPVISQVSRTPAAAAPVASPTDVNPLGVAVEADRPRRADTGTDRLLPFRLAVNLETLTFQRRGNVLRAEFTVNFVVAAPDGTVWPVDTREHSLRIPLSETPEALGEHVSYSWAVDLAPLRLPKAIPLNREGMQLVVTVEDRASHVQSVVKIPIPNR